MTDVLVVAELADGKVRKSTLSAISFAKAIEADFDVLAIGEGAADAAAELTGFGAGEVLTAEVEGGYVSEHYAPTVAEVADDGDYDVVVACATSYGKDLMPRVAAKLKAGVASDISAVEVDGDDLIYTRPMYAGNVIGKVKIKSDVQVVTVRQTEFEAPAGGEGASPIEAADVEDPTDAAERIEAISLEVAESERPDLTEAEVVVAGGRALKSAENF